MIQYNNPAGRLYDLLGQFREAQTGTVAQVWSQIFEVPVPTVRKQLSSVAELVTQIDRFLAHPDGQAFVAHAERYRDNWLEAIFPLEHSFSTPAADVRPNDVAYEALGTIAAYLKTVAPEGEMPSEERQAELLEDVRVLMQEVNDDGDLPEEVAPSDRAPTLYC